MRVRFVQTVLVMAAVCSMAAETPALEERMAQVEAEVQALRAELRRLDRPTRAAIEDYLDDRGITGLALVDTELRPLDRVLRRAVLSSEVRARYESLRRFEPGRQVDFSELRATLGYAYALAGGAEIDVALQALGPAQGLMADAVFDPNSSLVIFHPDEAISLRRASLRLPSVNLLGRLLRWPVTLVIGRQEIALGSGFIMGSDDAQFGLSHDGLRLYGESGSGHRFDFFASRASHGGGRMAALAGADPRSVDGSVLLAPEIELAGARGQFQGLLQDTTLAVYLVGSRHAAIDDAPPYPALPETELLTLGVEASAKLAPEATVRFDGAMQGGRRGAADVRGAGAAELRFDWTAPGFSWSAFGMYSTGDDLATAGRYEAFTPLAQDTRRRWDEFGLLASRNVWLLGGRARLGAGEVLVTQAYASDPGTAAGLFPDEPVAGAGRTIGTFVTLAADWRLFMDAGSRARVAYSWLFPGSFFDARENASALSLEIRAGF